MPRKKPTPPHLKPGYKGPRRGKHVIAYDTNPESRRRKRSERRRTLFKKSHDISVICGGKAFVLWIDDLDQHWVFSTDDAIFQTYITTGLSPEVGEVRCDEFNNKTDVPCVDATLTAPTPTKRSRHKLRFAMLAARQTTPTMPTTPTTFDSSTWGRVPTSTPTGTVVRVTEVQSGMQMLDGTFNEMMNNHCSHSHSLNEHQPQRTTDKISPPDSGHQMSSTSEVVYQQRHTAARQLYTTESHQPAQQYASLRQQHYPVQHLYPTQQYPMQQQQQVYMAQQQLQPQQSSMTHQQPLSQMPSPSWMQPLPHMQSLTGRQSPSQTESQPQMQFQPHIPSMTGWQSPSQMQSMTGWQSPAHMQSPPQMHSPQQHSPTDSQSLQQHSWTDSQPLPQCSPTEGQPLPQFSPIEGQPLPQCSPTEGQPLPQCSPTEGQPLPEMQGLTEHSFSLKVGTTKKRFYGGKEHKHLNKPALKSPLAKDRQGKKKASKELGLKYSLTKEGKENKPGLKSSLAQEEKKNKKSSKKLGLKLSLAQSRPRRSAGISAPYKAILAEIESQKRKIHK